MNAATFSQSTSAASCPCCCFLLNDGLFLPLGEESDINANEQRDEVKPELEDLLSSTTEIISPMEAWKKISDDDKKRRILLVDTHGHPHLQRDIQYADDNDDAAYSVGEKIIMATSSQSSTATEKSGMAACTQGATDEAKERATTQTSKAATTPEGVVSLTCAVSPKDWNDALDYASQSPWILPALGVHPWYLGDILVTETAMVDEKDDIAKHDEEHGDETEEVADIARFLQWEWLHDLETHLSHHPHLLVGEIGLCKMARFVREFPKEKGGKATALRLQKLVFRKQLDLAAKWCRPVTIHCVNMHGVFMEVLNEILMEAKECNEEDEVKDGRTNASPSRWRKAFPPAIAMHSFTGTAHHVREILEFEKELLRPKDDDTGGRRRRKQQRKRGGEEKPVDETSPTNEDNNSDRKDILFYFGFSHAVNHLMCTSDKARQKGMEAVRSVPPDRLLIESDVHATADVALGTAGAAAYVAHARGEKVKDVAERSMRNGLRYLSSLSVRQLMS